MMSCANTLLPHNPMICLHMFVSTLKILLFLLCPLHSIPGKVSFVPLENSSGLRWVSHVQKPNHNCAKQMGSLQSFTIVNIFCVYIYMCYHVLHRTPHVDCQYPPPIRGVGGTWALAHSITTCWSLQVPTYMKAFCAWIALRPPLGWLKSKTRFLCFNHCRERNFIIIDDLHVSRSCKGLYNPEDSSFATLRHPAESSGSSDCNWPKEIAKIHDLKTGSCACDISIYIHTSHIKIY